MSDFWGVDSWARSDKAVGASTGKASVFDHLVTKGLKPDFFGRYLGKSDSSLTADEARFLLQHGCRIVPVYRGEPRKSQKKNSKGETYYSKVFEAGSAAANNAIEAANAVGMPGGVVIYADIEAGEDPGADYIVGWCRTMWHSKFGGAGGFYCDNRASAPFMKSLKKARERLEAEEDMGKAMKDRISLWCQFRYLGDNQPGQNRVFKPEKPDFLPSGPAVWQYSRNCLPFTQKVAGTVTSYALIDKNVATQNAFKEMWK
jgi:hypothetical protein